MRRTKGNLPAIFQICVLISIFACFSFWSCFPLFIKVDKLHLPVHENEELNLRWAFASLPERQVDIFECTKGKNLLIEQNKLVALCPDVIFA